MKTVEQAIRMKAELDEIAECFKRTAVFEVVPTPGYDICKVWRKPKRLKRAARFETSALRASARAAGKTRFEGTPCVCGHTLRATSTGDCIACRRKYQREWCRARRVKERGNEIGDDV